MTSAQQSCPIVMACDEGYAMPLATAMRSIVEANGQHWPLQFYVISDSFRARTRKRVLDSLPGGSATVDWLIVDLDRFQGLRTIHHISPITFARVLLAELLPPALSRVLYLDGDLLVLADLTPLLEVDLEGACIGAVRDFGLDPIVRRGDHRSVGIPGVPAYSNAGVLLIDMERWRKDGIGERASSYLRKNPQAAFADQDALNVALEGAWKELSDRWNFQDHLRISIARMSVSERPSVVHFVTSAKPWNVESRSLNADFYDGFRQRTRFSRTPRTNFRDVIRRTLFRAKGELKRSRRARAARDFVKLRRR